MIDLNDPQLDQHGKIVPLLTNITFKNQIEKGCPSLKDAKYIYALFFRLNMTELYDKEEQIEK